MRNISFFSFLIISCLGLAACSQTDVNTQAPAVNNEYTIPIGTLRSVVNNSNFNAPARPLNNENSIDTGVTAFRKGNDILIVANARFSNNRDERLQILIKNVVSNAVNRLDSIKLSSPGNLRGGQTYGLFGNSAMILTTDAPDVGGNSIFTTGTVGISEIVDNNRISGRFSFNQSFNGRQSNVSQGAFYRIPLR